jgi:hypothetical protein
MPQSSARLCAKFPDIDAACDLLKSAGFVFHPEDWTFSPPTSEHALTDDEDDALTYLVEEWDWGGLRRDTSRLCSHLQFLLG